MWRRIRYVLLLIALAALATCPAAWRDYRRKNRAAEAEHLLAYLARLVEAEYRDRGGRLPQQPVGPTPPIGRCCEQGGTCAIDKDAWADPAWRALRFSIDDAHRYSYQYELGDNGKKVTLRAIGDLDCDGSYGTTELTLEPDDSGGLTRTWRRDQPLE
jgi:hypothetical protein